MHSSEIREDAVVFEPPVDLKDYYGERPILAGCFAMVDGSDVLVPVAENDREGMFLALTREQGMQLLLAVAQQIGRQTSLTAITEDEG